jgi:mono/diheme cytochrome c family protein
MAQPRGGDGLLRWLLGGLVVGAIVLGLMVAAYAIGYDRGKSHAKRSTSAPAPSPTRTRTLPTTTQAAPPTTVPAAQLAARGKVLYTSDGCSACHSISGAAGAGPTFKGLAGSTVTLSDGSTVTADDAYLSRSITEPDAQIVEGYQPGIMSAAVAGYRLAGKPVDVHSLVAFVKTRR